MRSAPASAKACAERVDRLHHQVHVDRHLRAVGVDRVLAQRRADHRAEGQVRHVMVVHHVEVDPVGAGGDDVAHLVAEAREIGGQDARGDAKCCVMAADESRSTLARGSRGTRSRLLECAAWPTPNSRTSVAVRHLPEQSDPQAGQFAFAYTVTIKNSGDVAAQLIARHWIVTDANGHVEEVRGLAVVGHQPLLKPGETLRVHELDAASRRRTARCAAPSSA